MQGYAVMEQLRFFNHGPRESDVEKHDLGYMSTESRKREQLSQGWLAAFGTSGYKGEVPLLEELGVNFGHIRTKVSIVLIGLLCIG
jgi:hypothetical protein